MSVTVAVETYYRMFGFLLLQFCVYIRNLQHKTFAQSMLMLVLSDVLF